MASELVARCSPPDHRPSHHHTGDTRQLDFDGHFHHVIAPRHCRYHLYSQPEFVQCMGGRSILFIGDSIMEGFFQDVGQMFGRPQPSRSSAWCASATSHQTEYTLPGSVRLSFAKVHAPFRRGLLNVFSKKDELLRRIQRSDVVILGSFYHDLGLEQPFDTYERNLARLIEMLRPVRQAVPNLRLIWMLPTMSARSTRAADDCLTPLWPNQQPATVKFGISIALRAMRDAGIETFDTFSLMSTSDQRWFAPGNIGHLHACYGTRPTGGKFGGGLSKMITQALVGKICSSA